MIHLDIDPACFNDVYLQHGLTNQHRTQIYFGGSSSGKSVFLAQRTVLDVFGGKRNYLVVRDVARTLRQSCFNEIVKQISRFRLTTYFSVNKSDMVITCLVNRKQILFAGLDDPEKIKSITPQDGVITDIWVEEATECERDTVKQLEKRLRGQSQAKKRLTLSFNPILKSHWIYTEYFEGVWKEGSSQCESASKDLSILKTTYKDNKFLNPDDIDALENESDPYWYQVYTLGNWGIAGKLFFAQWRPTTADGSPWHVIPTDSCPKHWKYYLGIDYGYAAPWACYLIGVDYDKRVTICREVYDTNRSAIEQAEDMCNLMLANGIPLTIIKCAGHDVFAHQRNAMGAMEPIVNIWRGGRWRCPKCGELLRQSVVAEYDAPVCKRCGVDLESRPRLAGFVESGRDPLARATIIRDYLADWGPCEGWPEGRPGLQAMDCCHNFIRTIAEIEPDEHNPEVYDTDGEDHPLDAVGHVMSRYLVAPRKPESDYDPEYDDTDRRRRKLSDKTQKRSLRRR